MSDTLTDADLVERLKLVKKHGGNRTNAASEAGVGRAAFSESVTWALKKGLTAEIKIEDPLAKITTKLKIAERTIAAIRRENDTAESIRQTIYGLATNTPDPPKWLGNAHTSGVPGTPMMIWSDWHWGEVVKPGEVGGLNEFNSQIAAERLTRLVDHSIGLIRPIVPKSKQDGIVICLGGDMITGEIHDELTDTNDGYVQQSLLDLQEKLISAITRMADEFGRVFIPCVVGNHGRMTMKPRMKGRVYTSFEWNLYCQLEMYFKARKDTRVSFYIPGETDAYFTVNGHRFLLTHGDSLGVRGGDGIIGAIGPIMRGSFKVGRSEAEIGRNFDTILMGHWHQYISTRGIIVNNCLKGYDEYARLGLRAPATPASQALWFVHRKWGVNHQSEVFVQDPFRQATSDAWVAVFDKNR